MPLDGKGDRRIAQHAEVVRVMRVFPDVLPAHHKVPPRHLLQPGVKLVAIARRQRARIARLAQQQRIDHRVEAAAAGQHQVLVERRLQRSRIRRPQHRVGLLDAVRTAQPRFRLARVRQSVVHVAANPHVEQPVTGRDLVLKVERQLLHVRVAQKVVVVPAARQIVGIQRRARRSPSAHPGTHRTCSRSESRYVGEHDAQQVALAAEASARTSPRASRC